MNKALLILLFFSFCFVYDIHSQPHPNFYFPDQFPVARNTVKAKEARKTDGQTFNAANVGRNPSSNQPFSSHRRPPLKQSTAPYAFQSQTQVHKQKDEKSGSRKWSSFYSPFLTKLLEKKKNEFTAISPLGWYHTIGVLNALANRPSESAKELDNLMNIRDPSELKKINYILGQWNSHLKNINVHSSTYFIDKERALTSIPAVQTELKNTGVTAAQDPSMIKASLEEQLHFKNWTTLDMQIPSSSQVILNLLYFNFKWLYDAEGGPAQYVDLYGKRIEDKISNLWEPIRINASAKYIDNDEYMAYKIELSNSKDIDYESLKDQITKEPLPVDEQPTAVTGLSTYILYIKNGGALTEETLRKVYDKVEQVKPTGVIVDFPPFKLEENNVFTANELPTSLRQNNPDFSSSFSQSRPRLQLRQNIKICSDVRGIRAESSRYTNFWDREVSRKADLFFNRPFYVVIYDNLKTRSPIFIGHVRKPRIYLEYC